MSMTPAVRFKGFTDPWEQRKLGDIAVSFEYGLNAAACEYDGVNKYLRITDIDDDTHEFRVEDLTSPQADLAASAGYLLSEGDLLFARTGASVGKTYLYRPFDGKVFFAGFLIRAKIGNNADPEFVFQSTLTDRYRKYVTITSQRSGQPGVNAQEYSDFELPLPSQPEQKQIGSLLHGLDNLITLHQRKYDQLAVLKKALLDKMFPRDGAFVPEIRFVGFTDPWEQRKLGELTKEIRRVEPDSDAPVMMISTPADGFIYQSQHYAFDNTGESLKKYICLHKGEMAYNHGASRLRPYGSSFVLKEEQARVPFVYHCYEVLDDDPDFISLQLNLDSMQLQLRKLISSGARMDGLLNISYEEYMSLVLLVPDVEEQRRISRLLASLNNLITLHQRKLGLLKNLKAALLDKMFV